MRGSYAAETRGGSEFHSGTEMLLGVLSGADMSERQKIEALFQQLEGRPKTPFPKLRQPLLAPKAHGVYVIRDPKGRVVHVGRSVWGKGGLFQRLHNHLHAHSSFVHVYL
jgi:hypothetical protein